jgi:DNA-binding transcriptional ArsR family regulator
MVHVREVAPAAAGLRVEVDAGGAYELLIELAVLTGARYPEVLDGARLRWLEEARAGLPGPLRRDLDRVGDTSGEVWLHLLGLAMEAPPPRDAAALLARVEATDPLEVRRHLLGAFVPAWRRYVEPSVLLAAAEGDRAAQARLLADGRYYAGSAAAALSTLLPLRAGETKRRLLAVLRGWHSGFFAAREGAVTELLERDAAAKRALAGLVAPERLIELAAGGYAYEREPECPRVLLLPHLAARPWLLLCQHRATRVICYPASTPGGTGEARDRLLRLGRALGDEQRLRILTALAAGDRGLDDLATELELARSTVHHHLEPLRAAGLVGLRGNARRYLYTLRREAAGELSGLLAVFLGQAPPAADQKGA